MKPNPKTLILIALISLCSYAFSQNSSTVKGISGNKAVVYIYRPGRFTGAAVNYYVYANDIKVSEKKLKNNSYLVFYAEPGIYKIWASVSTIYISVELNVEAGKTYYVRAKHCRAFTIPVTEEAEKEIVNCNLSE
ncbi:MAG: DUF2846 domain-containing protein [Bacteroidota bacterium]